MEELQAQSACFLDKLRITGGTPSKKVLLLGRLNGEHKKNVSFYLNRLAKYDKERDWIFLSESALGERCEWFQSMEILTMPCLFLQNQYKGNASIPNEPKGDIDICLKEAAYAMQFKMEGMPIEYAFSICQKAEAFYHQVLEILQPDKVYIWNAFTPLHKVLQKYAGKRK